MPHLDMEQAIELVRKMLGERKDPQLAEFVKLSSDAMNARHMAKSWSVLMYLLERDRAQTREYLLRAGQGNGSLSTEAQIVTQFFPEFPAWKDLDEAWREWATDVYREGR